MKLKFTRKTWYFFLLAAAAVSMLGGFAVLGGMDFSGLEMIVFCLTGIAVLFLAAQKGAPAREKRNYTGVFVVLMLSKLGASGWAGDICSALVWPALLATEYERGKPIQRQLQLVSAAEVLRLVFWMLTKYAGMSGLAFWTNIMFVLLTCARGWAGLTLYKTQEETRAQVLKVMEVVGLNTKYYNRYPHEFSGGQRQRIGLARAMVMDPELVVADEPISALDVSIRAQVLNLLKKFQRERGTTYLFIAHDLSIVRFISDRIGVIYKGDIVEVATAEELFDFPMHPYTRSLISAIPIPDPNLEKHKVLFSYDPSQHDYSEDKPELTDIGHGHFVFGNKKEIEEYKRLREEGTPIKSVTIAGVNAPADAKTAEKQLEEKKIEGSILDTPLHDTGSFWLAFLSFFLAIPGLIAGAIFKKHNYIRNYKKCKKGAIAGLITTAAIIVLFGLMLIISIL